jgi:integrase
MGKRLPREVEPIKNVKDIARIKQYLLGKENKRDYLMFTLGINLGLRISDLLKLKITDVLEPGTDSIKNSVLIREQKTGKINGLELNRAAKEAIKLYLNSLPDYKTGDYLFESRKGTGPITTRSAHRIIKSTIRELKIKGNFGTHSLRKTFGYHRYINSVKLETLQKVFNHSSPAITLRYIGITKEVIADAYNSVNL